MIEVRPFQGLRPNLDSIEQLISPPYDVVDQSNAQKFLKGNPLSFLRVIRPDLEALELSSPSRQDSLQQEPSEQIFPKGEEIYFRARSNLKKLIDNKALLLEKEPLFLYL